MESNDYKAGIEYFNKKEYKSCIKKLILLDSIEYPLVNYYLGISYIKDGDFERGNECLEIFVEDDDNILRVFQVKMLISYAYILDKKYKNARYILDSILESGYESAKTYSLLGYIYYKTGVNAKALQAYEKALELEPDNINALNSLGYILSEYPDRLSEAEEYCRQALMLNTGNPAYLDTMGWICFKSKKIEASKVFLGKALEALPDNPEVKEHFLRLNDYEYPIKK